MTRWKHEPTVSVLLLHAHNSMSNWSCTLLDAAEELCGNLGCAVYANHHSGTDREWYVSAAALARVGGMKALEERTFTKLTKEEE